MRRALGLAESLAGLAASVLAGRILLAQETPLPEGYAGSAACVPCHEDLCAGLSTTTHASLESTPFSKGCEACHGPAKAHAEDPTDDALLRKIRRLETDRCFLCHSNVVTKEAWEKSEYHRAGKTCLDCHRVHVDGSEAEARFGSVEITSLKTATEAAKPVGNSACLGCHVFHGDSLRGTGHETLGAASSTRPDLPGCESCHGAGSLHVASFGRKALIYDPPRDNKQAEMEACIACHRKVVEDSHFIGSEFDRAGLRCTTCHEVHVDSSKSARPAPEPFRGPHEARARATAVGSAICGACHAQAVTEVAGTPHAPLLAAEASGRASGACEACHGPGSVHVRTAGKKGTILRVTAIPAEESSRICLTCHEQNPHVHGFRESSHALSGIGCVSCHPEAAHGRLGPPRDEPDTCRKCHAEVVAQFGLPNHHPVPEGGMNCSSCHAVHERVSMIHDLKLRQKSCEKCHPQYEGPFVFAHEASRVDGCTACHAPHGSVNRRLLSTRDVRTLCLPCHPNTPPNHEQRPGSIYRRCLDCHSQIHGSDVNRLFLR